MSVLTMQDARKKLGNASETHQLFIEIQLMFL